MAGSKRALSNRPRRTAAAWKSGRWKKESWNVVAWDHEDFVGAKKQLSIQDPSEAILDFRRSSGESRPIGSSNKQAQSTVENKTGKNT